MTYTEYKSARQGEFNALPIFWAFSNKQFEEAMQERGLTMQDTDKVFSIGAGGFALTSDKDVILAFLKKEDPLPKLMKDPAFAADAFFYEMCNHEYGINWQGDWDVCSCFGDCEYSEDKGGADYLTEMGYGNDTISAYFQAKKDYWKAAEENEWF